MSTKKTKKKKKSAKKAVAKKASNKSLSPEEKKTRLNKLYKELGNVEDQKEKKNIRAKLRATDKNWKDTLGIKSEKKATKKKTKKKATKTTSSEGKKTKKKKKSATA